MTNHLTDRISILRLLIICSCLIGLIEAGWMDKMKDKKEKCVPEVVAIKRTKIVPVSCFLFMTVRIDVMNKKLSQVAVPIKSKKKPSIEITDSDSTLKLPELSYPMQPQQMPNPYETPPEEPEDEGEADDGGEDEHMDPYPPESVEESEAVEGQVADTVGYGSDEHDDDDHDEDGHAEVIDSYQRRMKNVVKRAAKPFFAATLEEL